MAIIIYYQKPAGIRVALIKHLMIVILEKTKVEKNEYKTFFIVFSFFFLARDFCTTRSRYIVKFCLAYFAFKFFLLYSANKNGLHLQKSQLYYRI